VEGRIIKILSDIYQDSEEGGEVLIKRDAISKCFLYTEDILGVCEVLNKRGRIYKSRCQIYHKDLGNVIIKHKFDDVKGWMSPKLKNKIGFKI